jgi:hypothetical protein
LKAPLGELEKHSIGAGSCTQFGSSTVRSCSVRREKGKRQAGLRRQRRTREGAAVRGVRSLRRAVCLSCAV